MKVEELMLNDLVLCKGTVYTVISIDYIGSLVGIERENDIDLVHIDEIEPIPLTEEILKKNGFSTTDEKYYYIEETENKFGYSFAIRRNRTGLFCIVCDQVVILEYVHQIQHLLRLCGLNDMADNLKVE